MTNEKVKLKGPLYSCSVCVSWVPEFQAIAVETRGYAEHICGAKCHEEWRPKQKAKKQTRDLQTE